MVRFVDNEQREQDILNLIIDSYIEESKPISSSYLCQKYNLNYSPATVRNIMLSLEKQGFLFHIHTSSGRVPTKLGFKRYVRDFNQESICRNYPVTWDSCPLAGREIDAVINYTLDSLAQFTGCTSLIAISARQEKVFYRGIRFIFEQPEFEDVRRLRDIFYVLEVKMDLLQDLLFHCIEEKVKILIGDEIGFAEIADCSLVVSGLKKRESSFALALLGPMRMNYGRAVACLYSARNQLKDVVEEFV